MNQLLGQREEASEGVSNRWYNQDFCAQFAFNTDKKVECEVRMPQSRRVRPRSMGSGFELESGLSEVGGSTNQTSFEISIDDVFNIGHEIVMPNTTKNSRNQEEEFGASFGGGKGGKVKNEKEKEEEKEKQKIEWRGKNKEEGKAKNGGSLGEKKTVGKKGNEVKNESSCIKYKPSSIKKALINQYLTRENKVSNLYAPVIQRKISEPKNEESKNDKSKGIVPVLGAKTSRVEKDISSGQPTSDTSFIIPDRTNEKETIQSEPPKTLGTYMENPINSNNKSPCEYLKIPPSEKLNFGSHRSKPANEKVTAKVKNLLQASAETKKTQKRTRRRKV